MKWSIETGGTLGDGGTYNPVIYPRSDADRGFTGDGADPAAHESESGEMATGISDSDDEVTAKDADK